MSTLEKIEAEFIAKGVRQHQAYLLAERPLERRKQYAESKAQR